MRVMRCYLFLFIDFCKSSIVVLSNYKLIVKWSQFLCLPALSQHIGIVNEFIFTKVF